MIEKDLGSQKGFDYITCKRYRKTISSSGQVKAKSFSWPQPLRPLLSQPRLKSANLAATEFGLSVVVRTGVALLAAQAATSVSRSTTSTPSASLEPLSLLPQAPLPVPLLPRPLPPAVQPLQLEALLLLLLPSPAATPSLELICGPTPTTALRLAPWLSPS
jgi:hypothetical protein